MKSAMKDPNNPNESIYTTNCARFWSFSHGAPLLFALPPEATLEGGIRYVQISSLSEHASVFFCTMPCSLFSLSEAGHCCRAPLMYPIVTKSVTVNSFFHVHSLSSMKFIDSLHWLWCFCMVPEHDDSKWGCSHCWKFHNSRSHAVWYWSFDFLVIGTLLTSKQCSRFFMYIYLHIDISSLTCLLCDLLPTTTIWPHGNVLAWWWQLAPGCTPAERGPHSFAGRAGIMNNM